MSVVVNVMLSLMSVMSPPTALCNLSVRTAVKLCIFLCFGFRGELGFLNCDDVCMCVVNKQFELLEFVSESVYVDLQYDEISLTFTAAPVCLCCVSSPCVGSQQQIYFALSVTLKTNLTPMFASRLHV